MNMAFSTVLQSHSTCRFEDLQRMEAVSRPLNEGIISICNICKSLKNVHVDPTTDMCSNFKQIREHIEHAELCLKTSETVIKEKLGNMDGHMEQLIRTKKNIEEQKKEKYNTLGKLQIEKNSAEEMLRYSKAVLQQAENSLEMAKYARRSAENRRNNGEGLAIAGGVVTFAVPIFGWIAGPVMLSEGVRELNEASEAISRAEQDQQKFDYQVKEKTRTVYEYQSKITSKQYEIEQTNRALKRIDGEIVDVQTHLEITGNIQEMVRKAVNLLSILSGRVNVLEKQTQRSIYWQPVVNTMEEVMKAVVDIASNRLLCGDCNPGIITTLRDNIRGLLALCNSPSVSDSYY
ncbi:myosin-13-like [Pseudorasbora parva]|uniref:myosin-13-like n=1 Tax=Pseudorasbora parva TaxID=51549 RepID=UPI00351DBF46